MGRRPRQASLTERLKRSIAAILVVAALPWLLAPVGRMIRRGNGPGDPAAVLWWPVDDWHVVLPFAVSLLAGLAVGRLLFLRRNPVKAALFGLVAIAFTSIIATALSWSSMVKVYPDRVEWTQGRFPVSAERTSLDLSRATAVEVYCYLERARRKQPIAHLAYVVHLPELGPIDLGAAMLNPKRQSDSRLGLLQEFDEGALQSVPGVGDGAQAGECLRLLRRQLGGDKFTIVRRLMRIDDHTYLRLYAEPYESWNGRVDR